MNIAKGIKKLVIGVFVMTFVLCVGAMMPSVSFSKVYADSNLGYVSSIYAQGSFTYMVKSDGTLWVCGCNDGGQPGDGTTISSNTWKQVLTGVSKVFGISSGYIYVLKSDGTLWGFNENNKQWINLCTDIKDMSKGINQSPLILKKDGTAWTINNANNLGTVEMQMTDVDKVDSSIYDSYILKKDGTLWASGINDNGQLGDGTTTYSSTYKQIASNVKDVSHSSYGTTYIVKTDGTLWAAGKNDEGQFGDGTKTDSHIWKQVLTNVSKVYGGYGSNGFAIKTDGTLWATGYNVAEDEINNDGTLDNTYNGKYGLFGDGTATSTTTWKQIATNVVQVSSELNHTVIVRTDGTLWATGGNKYGQLGDGTTTSRNTWEQVATNVATTVPTPVIPTYPIKGSVIVNSKTIAAANSNIFVIKPDGTLWGIGYNRNGQLNDGTTMNSSTWKLIGSDFIKVCCNNDIFALKADGTLLATGGNRSGELGNGTTSYTKSWTQVLTDVTDVCCGYNNDYSLALKKDGTLWVTGNNSCGEFGDGTTTGSATWKQVGSGFTQIACGYNYSIALKADGTVWTTGYNYNGELGNGTLKDSHTWIQVLDGVSEISATSNASYAIKKDGTLWKAGDCYNSCAIGLGYSQWRQVGTGFVQISGANNNILALKEDGTLWGAGENASGQLGNGTTTKCDTLKQIDPNLKFSQISVGDSGSVALKTDGTVWATGAIFGPYIPLDNNDLTDSTSWKQVFSSLDYTVPTAPTLSESTTAPTNGNVTVTINYPPNAKVKYYKIGATGAYQNYTAPITMGVNDTIYAKCQDSAGNWSPESSLLINNITVNVNQNLLNDVRTIGTDGCSFIIKSDGTVWAAGANINGQLGIGNTTNSTVWKQVLKNGTYVSVKMSTFVLKSDGTLWATGLNENGELGIGTTTNISTWRQVLTGVTQVMSSGSASFAIKADGTLWATGYNNYGQLGTGNTTQITTWKRVGSGFIKVWTAKQTSFALKADGTLWACGRNDHGQYGDGTTVNSSTWKQIGSDFSQAYIGNEYALAIKTDGSLWATGDNTYGQLGDGTLTSTITWKQVGLNFAKVVTGNEGLDLTATTLGIKTDGTLWVCGDNSHGQYGDGTEINVLGWKQVGSNFCQISNDADTSFALKNDGTVWATGGNYYGQFGDGTTTGTNVWKQVASGVATALIDKTNPVMTLKASSKTATNGDVTITATATDNLSGVASITLPDNTVVTGPSATYTATANGIYTFKCTDKSGNTVTQSITVSNIDKTPPTAPSINVKGNQLTITAGKDDGSGVKETDYQLNNGAWNKYTVPVTLSGSSYTIKAKTIDNAGNVSSISTISTKLTGIALSKTSDELKVGQTDILTAEVTPDNAVNKTVKWTSSDSSVAAVDQNGKVTALKAGTAVITAATTDGSNLAVSCDVIVKESMGVTLSKDIDNLAVGETDKLKATVTSDNDNKTVKWTSSDTSVATVDQNGNVTAVKAGTAKITAMTQDGNNLSAFCTINVEDVTMKLMLNMTNGTLRQYKISESQFNDFLEWYNARGNNQTSQAYYIFNIPATDLTPASKEYVFFTNIESFKEEDL